MEKRIITFIFLTCGHFCLVYSIEKGLYPLNIEKTFEACHFNENSESLTNPNLREKIKKLFIRIYENEKFYPDFIQCITAQDSLFFAYQVIAKELYRKLYGITRDDFEFEESYSEFQNNRQEGCFRTFRNFQARIIAGSLFEKPMSRFYVIQLFQKKQRRNMRHLLGDAIDDLLSKF